MSLPITAVGPLNVEMKPILTVFCCARAGETPSATSAQAAINVFFMSVLPDRHHDTRSSVALACSRSPHNERPTGPPGTKSEIAGIIQALRYPLLGIMLGHCTGSSARSLKRWILPVAVFGSSRRNSIQRGYL